MDKLTLSGAAFYAYHGVNPEEGALGQKFFVDVTVYADDLSEAGRTDDIAFTVSYSDIYAIVRDVMTNGRFKLIEAAAERIAEKILDRCALAEEDAVRAAVREVAVKIKKPGAPIPGVFDYVAVEISRKQISRKRDA